jgi:hypothetical protein
MNRSDDSGFIAPADRKHDPCRLLSSVLELPHYVDKIDGPKRAFEAGGSNVIRPTIHRPMVLGDERSDGDFGTDQHRSATPKRSDGHD